MTSALNGHLKMISIFFFLFVGPGFVFSQVFQPEQLVYVEGDKIEIICNQNATSHDTMFWYKQESQWDGGKLSFLGSGFEGDSLPAGDFLIDIIKKSRLTKLTREGARLSDGGVYFGSGTGWKVTFGTGTRLVVIPDLERSDPSVYKLKPSSDEKQGKAACLYTDYSPNPLDVRINKEGTEKVNGSVVVVKEDQSAKGTASYGIVLWGNDDDSFHCPEPKDSGTCLEEGGDITFETDERLNLLSLTVLGLRVIFLKTVAFNLLFTFRLWSR